MTYDVIVIGGGAIGTNTAYELSKQGLKVALLEKKRIASGASGASAAMLEFQIDAHRGEPFFSLSKASNDLFPALYQEIKNFTKIDFQFEQCGILHVASTVEETATLQKEVEWQKGLGLKISWLDHDLLQKHFPYLNPDHHGGVFYHEDGQVHGEMFTSALAFAARQKGADVHTDVGEIKFELTKGTVTGVRTHRQVFQAKKYVVTTGAWADQILEPMDIKLGIVPVRGQLVIFDTPPEKTLPHPIYTERSGYITPKRNGTTLAGTTVEQVGFDERVTDEGKAAIVKLACDLVPSFANKKIRGISAGLRPGSPDGLPFLGPVRTHDNVIISAGHYRNGILLSPISAKIVTSLVLGQNPMMDLNPFSPSRRFPAPSKS